ncbi:MAG: DNA polymerase I [Deltaproteobacteria bacterium]|jgi:DNA polymerase-1|nr:DNA polymerase I [Deltaproteobacteria bacterium]
MPIRRRLDLESEPVFLMDGSAYIFRSFYANQNMSRSDGAPTNVLYMVLRLLFRILREENPVYFAFVLDGRGENFRHRLYSKYKGNRQATPEPLSAQIPPLCSALDFLGLPLIVSRDCEADDCIASLAARFSPECPVLILGADKDLRQCLSPAVSMWDPSSREERLLTLEDFRREQGFEPEFWPDYQALVGDSSDNIPGVPGIGPKGAETLLRSFRGLEEIFGHLPAVPPALRKKLEGMEERAQLSRRLAALRLDVSSGVVLDSIRRREQRGPELLSFLRSYELRSLEREFLSMLRLDSMARERDAFCGGKPSSAEAGDSPGGDGPGSGLSASGRDSASSDRTPEAGARSGLDRPSPDRAEAARMEQGSLLEVLEDLSSRRLDILPLLRGPEDIPEAEALALIPLRQAGGADNDRRLLLGDETRAFICDLSGAAPASGRERAAEYADVAPESPVLSGLIRRLSSSPGRRLVVPALKEMCESCPELRRIPPDRCFDLGLAAWLLSPEEYDYSFPRLLRRWGPEVPLAPGDKDAPLPTALALFMEKLFRERLRSLQLDSLLRDLEMPLIPVLLDMQETGLGIDSDAFRRFLDESRAELEALTGSIYAAAGREFNIRSSRQLGDILYSLPDMPKARKTAGGQISTAQDALEKLRNRHPVIQLILDYRKLEKLRSTYLEPLPKLADARGRLHTSFNQTATATGRLSSSGPNLQNIPVRGPLGSRMRAGFTAAPGNLLVSADYSQIELRVLAHLSQDPTLLEAFRRGEDIHGRTAGLLFDLSPAEVSPDQRRKAKTINFGLVYGMGPQKLAQDLGVSLKEAKGFIARYFERLDRLRAYFDAVEQSARENGYVSTMTGRRRFCPDILSANPQLRSQARRQAINTCIQGSAADIIKLAMLAVARDAELKSLKARLVLQIHDELLLECPEANAGAAGERLARLMSGVTPGGQRLSVPLAADYGSGKSWADAH